MLMKLGHRRVIIKQEVPKKSVKGSVDERECSGSEGDSDTDVSNTDEEVIGTVGMWSGATKKSRKGKQIVYICAGGRKNVEK